VKIKDVDASSGHQRTLEKYYSTSTTILLLLLDVRYYVSYIKQFIEVIGLELAAFPVSLFNR